MLKKRVGLTVAGLLSAVCATSALAAVDGPPGDGPGAKMPRERGASRALQRLDADNDQSVTMDEYLRRRTERFTRLDKNADGVLDEAELLRGNSNATRRAERMLRRLDQDADGNLTQAEFQNHPARKSQVKTGEGAGRFAASRAPERRQRMFELYDRNGDGVVEKAEFETTVAEESDYRRRRALHVLDRDSNGKVTLEEYTADARARFLRLDLDRDGRITPSDLSPMARRQWTSR